ncbi:hypothetical protein V8C86DRAFT_2784019 [Haematococcus lacustris]
MSYQQSPSQTSNVATPAGWAAFEQDSDIASALLPSAQSASPSVVAPIVSQPTETEAIAALAAQNPAAAVAEEPSQRSAVALYAFVAELEGELNVAAGDELEVGEEAEGWYQAKRLADGQEGLVPAAYVQLQ